MQRLKKRAEFLYVARGERCVSEAFVLQARRRVSGTDAEARAGFTASRKVGNAVARNRARRRLKEAARRVLTSAGIAGYDYVVVARPPALTRPFADMLADLAAAMEGVHRKRDGIRHAPTGRRRSRRKARAGGASDNGGNRRQ